MAQGTWKGKKVTLNAPRKIAGVTPAGKKKSVFVKSDKGNVKVVHFGDSSMSDFTQHHNEKRRKNFHARHNCAEKTNKKKAGYWACNDLW